MIEKKVTKLVKTKFKATAGKYANCIKNSFKNSLIRITAKTQTNINGEHIARQFLDAKPS